MKKFFPFLSFGVLLLVIFSCVPPDPNAVYGLNGQNITGPRIITKIDSANVVKTQFESTNTGKLEKVIYNSADFEKIYYLNNKISKIEFYASPTQMNATMDLTYNSSGTLINTKFITFMNGAVHSETQANIIYTGSKLTKVEKKLKFSLSNDWTHYTELNLTYNGENVIKVTEDNAMIINGVNQPFDPTSQMIYAASNFDSKINPLTTLPFEYNVAKGNIGTFAMLNLSYNNAFTISMSSASMPGSPIFSQNIPGFLYDAQNYPISDLQQIKKIYYKAIQ